MADGQIFDRIPVPVVDLCTRLQRAGYQAYAVGGSVRDLLLGRPVGDWDVATSAQPHEVQRDFRRTIPTGIKHGTVTVIVADQNIEVTTFRGEGDYSDGRRPDDVEFVSDLQLDLERRDFTINAIALDPVNKTLIDPMGGVDDLQRRCLRAVGNPEERFLEDGLRTMRLVRFVAVLEFDPEPQTLAAVAGGLDSLRCVSAERVRDELLKVLGARQPSRGVRLMQQVGILGHVLPELDLAVGVLQNRYHQDDVFDHSLKVCDAIDGDPVLRLAGLLHDVGKPAVRMPSEDDSRENRFIGHDAVGARMCAAIARRLKLSNDDRERLVSLVRHHMYGTTPYSAAGVRRFVRRVGADLLPDLFALRRADLASRDAHNDVTALEYFHARCAAELSSDTALEVSQLEIRGRDVMDRAGKPAGPYVGRVLRALLERVTDDPSLNQRELLLDLVDDVLEEINDSE